MDVAGGSRELDNWVQIITGITIPPRGVQKEKDDAYGPNEGNMVYT